MDLTAGKMPALPGQSFFGAGVFYIFIDGEQVLQARYGDNGNRLAEATRPGRTLCPDSGGLRIGRPTRQRLRESRKLTPLRIENDALRGFRSKLRQEFVDGLNAKFSIAV